MINWDVVAQNAMSGGITVSVGALLAAKPWRRHRANQERIADLLDTNTPGGLADLLALLQEDRP